MVCTRTLNFYSVKPETKPGTVHVILHGKQGNTAKDLMKIISISLASTQGSSCPLLKQQEAPCASHKPAEQGGAGTHPATSIYHPQQVFIGINGTQLEEMGRKSCLI